MELRMDDSEEAPKETKSLPVCQSQTGFIEVDLLRGFDEIRKIYKILRGTGSFICGGYARWCASPKPLKKAIPGDVDIYSPNEESFQKIASIFKEAQLAIKHENDISITYRKQAEGIFKYCPVIQLIKPVKEGKVVASGTMEEVLENFDFTVVRAAIVSNDTVLVDADFMHDEERKILRLKNIHCPVSSTLRCMKYAAKGYWLPISQALKLFLDWEGRTEAYKDELIDFVLRVDKGEQLSKDDINKFELLLRRD